MSLRAWIILLLVYLAYLAMGGFIFQEIESPSDCSAKKKELEKRRELADDIRKFQATLTPNQLDEFSEILDTTDQIDDIELEDLYPQKEVKKRVKLKDTLKMDENTLNDMLYEMFYNDGRGGNVSLMLADDDPQPLCNKWSYYNSFFFSFTALTTIGYGHLAPLTQKGRIVCVFYSLLGVPINGIVIGALGGFFDGKLKKFRQTRPQSPDVNALQRILLLMVRVIAFMVPGILFFMVLPAGIFCMLETNWTFIDSFYFTVITLTTIGFGDFVAGRNTDYMGPALSYVYGGAMIIWVIFGLGYVFMIIKVISEGLTFPAQQAAKKLRMAEKQLVGAILNEVMHARKRTQEEDDLFGGEVTQMTIVDENEVDDEDNEKPKGENSDIIAAAPEDQGAAASLTNEGVDQVDGDVQGLIEDLDHDTINSLHTFVSSALHVQRSMRVRKPTPPARFLTNPVNQEGEPPTPSTGAQSNTCGGISSIDAEELKIRQDASGDSFQCSSFGSDLEAHSRPTSAMSGRSIINRRFYKSGSKSSTKSLTTPKRHPGALRSFSSLSFNRNIQPHVLLESDTRQHSLPHLLKDITLQEVLQAVESLGLDKDDLDVDGRDR